MPPPANLDQLLQQIQYPGMRYVESRITQAWLVAHGAEYDRIDFDVRLGEGVKLEGDFSDEVRRMATLLTQKRVDVVAWRGASATILEVKIRIAFPAMGQLLGYRALWPATGLMGTVGRLLAIGRAVAPEAEAVLRSHGIDIELYPRAGDEAST